MFPLRNVQVSQDGHFRCTMHEGIEFSNAIRRTVISETTSYAPSEVDIEINTSCQTNEYIAHRIGLIPFCQKGLSDDVTVTLHVKDRSATSDDIVGDAKSHKKITIMKMMIGQELKLKVHFKKGNGSIHSRWCPIAACSHYIDDNDPSLIHFKFEMINDTDPIEVMKNAFLNLNKKLENLKEHA